MLKKADIDAVDICVPEDFHVAPAVAAANAKKDILLEKPIAKTVAESLEIKKAVDDNGVRMMIAHICKFDPRYVQLNDAIKAGKLGEITTLALKRTNSMGTPKRLKGKVSFFYYMGVHDIEWMLDYNSTTKPVKVYCQASDIVLKGLDRDARVYDRHLCQRFHRYPGTELGLPRERYLRLQLHCRSCGFQGCRRPECRESGPDDCGCIFCGAA